jgi:hypothetical protein
MKNMISNGDDDGKWKRGCKTAKLSESGADHEKNKHHNKYRK